jgi:hypothetical protein
MPSLAIFTSSMNDLASYCKLRPAGLVGLAFSFGSAMAGGIGESAHV